MLGQKEKLLRAKIAVALHDELGRVPKENEINQEDVSIHNRHEGLFASGSPRVWE
jgi:hypothetical protein